MIDSMSLARIRGGAVLMLALLALSACSNPEAQKRQHLEKGDQYAAEKRDEFAVVEYQNAIKIDPRFGEARLKLAETFERMNNLKSAFPEYVRAADALPDNRDVQLKAIRVLLLARRFEDAKARVDVLLTKNPQDVDALLLHANAKAGLRDPAGALAEIEEALKVDPASTNALVNLGAVRMQAGDAKDAETAFRRAIELAPDSVDAKLALANFLWSAQRAPEAEITLKEALAKDPQNLLANRMLALLYVSTQRVKEAEQPLKQVAEVSKTPASRYQLADYYAAVGKTTEAVSVLTSMSADPATFADAELRLAALDYAQGKVPEAHTRLDAVIASAPKYSPGLVTKAQWLTKENKLDEALKAAQAAVAADPESAAANFAQATVHDRRKEFAEATKLYNEVLRLNPRAAAAQIELSRLSLMSGDRDAALKFAEEARQVQPSSLLARVSLARSLVVAGNTTRAQTEIASLLKDAPNAAPVHAVNGLYEAANKNSAAARQAYLRALELSPGFLEAIGGLTYLDLAAKDTKSAIARLNAEIAKQPTSAALHVLLSSARGAAGDRAGEEKALRRAVSLDPRFSAAYQGLAQLYVRQNRIDEARAEFEAIARRDPSSAVQARTMIGLLFVQQGKLDEAQKAFEAAVSGTDNAPVAANNLAFLYAEQGTNLDVALQLATTAKQRLPDDANVDDTIGWIYYKKGMPSMAVRSFEDSLTKKPDAADVLAHLGLAYANIGEHAKARAALERAVKLQPGIGGDEVKRTLAAVSRQ
jgi:tetratricopeptide (TPR) repeat protein